MIKPFFSSSRFGVLVLTFLLSGSIASAVDWASIIRETGPGIAKITVKDAKGLVISQGTGFAAQGSDGEEIFVTNAHVVREAAYDDSFSITAQFLYGKNIDDAEDEQVYIGSIRYINYDLDLCVIDLDDAAPALLRFGEGQDPSLMSEIVVIGYPLGMNFKATPGFVQAFQDVEKLGAMMDMSSVLAPGNSGGPVIDSQGFVVGIATATIPGYNFNFALPIRDLLTILQEDSHRVVLEVRTDPPEAWIFVDGKYKGKSPLSLELLNKEYELRLEKEGYSVLTESVGPWNSGEEAQEFSRVLQSKEDMNPRITIVTEPEGAEVLVNNRLIGESPVVLQMAEGRIMRIKVRKGRYRDASQSYTVGGEAEQEVLITLEKKFLIW